MIRNNTSVAEKFSIGRIRTGNRNKRKIGRGRRAGKNDVGKWTLLLLVEPRRLVSFENPGHAG